MMAKKRKKPIAEPITCVGDFFFGPTISPGSREAKKRTKAVKKRDRVRSNRVRK